MNRTQYQGYRHNFRDLRRQARVAGQFRGLSPAMELFLSTFSRREREALTAASAKAEAEVLRKIARDASPSSYSGRAYGHAAALRRDAIARAHQLDRLAAELEASGEPA